MGSLDWRDHHSFNNFCIIRVKHVIKNALDEGDLVGGIGGCKLGQRVDVDVNESVNSLRRAFGGILIGIFCYLAQRTSDFEVEGRNGGVGGGDVGREEFLGDIFGVDSAAFCEDMNDQYTFTKPS